MKARGSTATPAEVTPTPSCSLEITPPEEMLESEIDPNKLLKIKGVMGTSQ